MEENKGSRAFLITAIGMGVLAMVLSFAYLQSKAGNEAAPVSIEVAAREMRMGTVVDPEKDFTKLDVPAELHALITRAIKPQDAFGFKGMKINRDIPATDPIMLGDFAPVKEMRLAPGKVALPLPVRGSNALPGLLVPGDYVKIMVTRPLLHARAPDPAAGPPSSSTWESVMVTPAAVKVLAVGSQTAQTGHVQVMDYQASGQASIQSITVEVTEAEAQHILEETGGAQSPITVIGCAAPEKAAEK